MTTLAASLRQSCGAVTFTIRLPSFCNSSWQLTLWLLLWLSSVPALWAIRPSRPSRCCGWILSWTRSRRWLLPLKCRLQICLRASPTVAPSRSFRGQWWKTLLVKAYTNWLLSSLCSSSVSWQKLGLYYGHLLKKKNAKINARFIHYQCRWEIPRHRFRCRPAFRCRSISTFYRNLQHLRNDDSIQRDQRPKDSRSTKCLLWHFHKSHLLLHLDCYRRLTSNKLNILKRWYRSAWSFQNYLIIFFLLDCDCAIRWSCFFDCPSDDCAMGLVHLFRCWYFSLGPIGDHHSHEQDSKDLLVCLITTSLYFFYLLHLFLFYLFFFFWLTFFFNLPLTLQLGSRTSWRYFFDHDGGFGRR